MKNTISAFLCVSESIPEDPESISNILQHIATCNAQAVIGTPGGTTHWPDLFYPTTTHCVLCNQELSSPIHPTGSSRKSYLLTKVQLFPVTAKIRKCTNQDCMARYSYSTWREGNIIFFLLCMCLCFVIQLHAIITQLHAIIRQLHAAITQLNAILHS